MRRVAGVLLSLLLGCASQVANEADSAASNLSGANVPAGHYSGAVQDGQIKDLQLNDDHTFARTFAGNLEDSDEGTYRFTQSKSGQTQFIRFSAGCVFTDRYAYKLSGD